MLAHMLMHPSLQGTLISLKAILAGVKKIQAYVHHLPLHLTCYFTCPACVIFSAPLMGSWILPVSLKMQAPSECNGMLSGCSKTSVEMVRRWMIADPSQSMGVF